MSPRSSLRENRIGAPIGGRAGRWEPGKTGFTKFKGVRLVDGAGHWPHEEQPEIVSQHLVSFLKST